MIKPNPVNEEIKLDPLKTIMSKTNSNGIIEYANDYFMEISGYKEWELMGKPHSIIRHPDMPKSVFKILWDRINEGIPTYAFVKNLAKSGKYYWVIAYFESIRDEAGNIKTHYAKRKAIPEEVKEEISAIYSNLLAIENHGGMAAAEAYLTGMLEDMNLDYDNFIYHYMRLKPNQLAEYINADSNTEYINTDMSAEEAIKKTVKKKRFFW